MKFFRKTFQHLCFLPALIGMDTTRHLTEDWPQFREKYEAPQSSGVSRASKKLRQKIEEIRILLQDMSSSLAASEDPACRADSNVAVEVLARRFEKQVPQFLACEGSCRATQARLEAFVDSLRVFEVQLVECQQSRRGNLWLAGRNSGFKGSIAAYSRRLDSNLDYLTQGSVGVPESPLLELRSELEVEAAYRSSKSWHVLRASSDLIAYNNIAEEFNYAVQQENVVQLRTQALKISAQAAKQREWFWGYVDRFDHQSLRVDGGWRTSSAAAHPLEFFGHYQTDTWGEDVWSRQSSGFTAHYFLSESLHENFRIEAGLDREVYPADLDAPLWVTRIGMSYERKVTTISQASLYFGLQDRRMSELGASLWPDIRLFLEGRDLFSGSLFPNFSFRVSPEANPSFFNTLDARASWGLTYRRSRFELPLVLSLGQAFQRGLPQQIRDYRLMELSMNARLKLSSALSMSFPVTWTRFWVLRSQVDNSAASVVYPDVEFSSSEAAVRIQYDF